MFPEDRHILVADSDPVRRELSERVLTEEGFAVTAVGEGFSAIRLATQTRFVLAVTTLELPGALDGLTTIRLIRARQPGLKALYTGLATCRPVSIERDRDEFIAAPFQWRELLGCVFELLQRRGPPRRDRGLTG